VIIFDFRLRPKRKFYGNHHDLINRYGISVSQMTTGMFNLLEAFPGLFPHLWNITWFTTRVTRRVPLVDQELLTLSEYLSSPPGFGGVRVARSLVFWVSLLFIAGCSFVPFRLAIVLSVLLTDSDYPFGIFQLFLNVHQRNIPSKS